MIVDAQSVGVDGISGATMSSNGIKDAVKAALEAAGADDCRVLPPGGAQGGGSRFIFPGDGLL